MFDLVILDGRIVDGSGGAVEEDRCTGVNAGRVLRKR
jgi:N-acyl-D-aspartate/D-glutamate deacylase